MAGDVNFGNMGGIPISWTTLKNIGIALSLAAGIATIGSTIYGDYKDFYRKSALYNSRLEVLKEIDSLPSPSMENKVLQDTIDTATH